MCACAHITAIAQIYLKDLGSSNGTFMNGVAVKGAQLLDDGDTIDFGVDVTEDDTERTFFVDDDATAVAARVLTSDRVA